MVGYYFEKRRAMAAGIASSGSGFGMLVLAPLAAYLVSEYHWKGTLVILAGVMLQGMVLGALMRPLELTKSPQIQSESELTEEEVLLAEQADQSQKGKQKQEDVTKVVSNCTANSSKETYPVKADESVLLYRKAIQNALKQKRSLQSTSSEYQLESQQGISSDSISSKHSDPALNSSGKEYRFQNGCTQSGSVQHNNVSNRKYSYSGKDRCFHNGAVHRTNHIGAKMSVTQSCHELPMGTPPMGQGHRVRANTESLCGKPNLLHVPWTNTGAQSCHEIYAKSHPHLGAQSTSHRTGTNKDKFMQELLKPLHRQDIFYSGSIASLPQYKSQPDLKSYIASVTVIPEMYSNGDASTKDKQCTKLYHRCCAGSSALDGLKNLIDLSILTNPYFLVICLASVFIQIGYFIPIVYIVDYAISLGSTTQEAAIIISVIG